jgi:Zn finger protein HypA/HybF involved in hydrogenase expression
MLHIYNVFSNGYLMEVIQAETIHRAAQIFISNLNEVAWCEDTKENISLTDYYCIIRTSNSKFEVEYSRTKWGPGI